MSGLELRGVVKRFGDVTVVQHLDLAIAAGEFMVLLGDSGCGKRTTLRMIAGLEEVTEGRVLIEGRDVTGLHPMARDTQIDDNDRCRKLWDEDLNWYRLAIEDMVRA